MTFLITGILLIFGLPFIAWLADGHRFPKLPKLPPKHEWPRIPTFEDMGDY